MKWFIATTVAASLAVTPLLADSKEAITRLDAAAAAAVRIEGGSVGLQIGGSTTDVIMLVMNERGADKLLSSKFTLGAEGTVAAGPVERTATAQTDAQMKADILSWSRS